MYHLFKDRCGLGTRWLSKPTFFALVAAGLYASSSVTAEEAKAKPETVVSVGTGQVALMTLNAHVAAYGMVEPAPASADLPAAGSPLTSPIAGIVTAMSVIEGQHVEKGDVLLRLKSRSSDSIASDLAITAPIAGTVTRIAVHADDPVNPATPLVELFDPGRLVVTGMVPVDDAAELKLNRPVEISTNLANSKVNSTLLYVSPQVDDKTGGVIVRASVPANSGLRPGQFVKLKIATEEHVDIMAIPADSFVNNPEIAHVLLFLDENTASQKPVRGGAR